MGTWTWGLKATQFLPHGASPSFEGQICCPDLSSKRHSNEDTSQTGPVLSHCLPQANYIRIYVHFKLHNDLHNGT